MHTQIFFFPRVFCPSRSSQMIHPQASSFPHPQEGLEVVEVKADPLCPPQRSCAPRLGKQRSGVMGEPPVGEYGGWGPRAWAETAPWHPLMVTVSASVTPCFCTLGQARGHGTCWLPRNEGMWGCRVTGMLPRWATGFVLQVFSFSRFSLSFHLQGDKGSRGEKVRTART